MVVVVGCDGDDRLSFSFAREEKNSFFFCVVQEELSFSVDSERREGKTDSVLCFLFGLTRSGSVVEREEKECSCLGFMKPQTMFFSFPLSSCVFVAAGEEEERE